MTPLDPNEQAIVKAARRLTGEQTPIRRQSVRPLLLAVSIAVASSAATWIAKTAWSGMTTAITAGKADVSAVESVKVDVATLQRSVTTLQTDVGEVKREQKESSKLLKRVARKLKVSDDQ